MSKYIWYLEEEIKCQGQGEEDLEVEVEEVVLLAEEEGEVALQEGEEAEWEVEEDMAGWAEEVHMVDMVEWAGGEDTEVQEVGEEADEVGKVCLRCVEEEVEVVDYSKVKEFLKEVHLA